MFVGCSNFTIQGGSLTNISNSVERNTGEPCLFCRSIRVTISDDRVIQVEAIDLRHFVRQDDIVKTRAVQKRRGGIRCEPVERGRRMTYHARIFGQPVTVMKYEGQDFDEWKSEMEKNHQERHHLLFQLFGITNSRSMKSFIFHDELLPVEQAISKFPTHLTRIYSLYVLGMQLESFRDYCEWFRLSTGSLCVEPGAESPGYSELRSQKPDQLGSFQILIPSACTSDSDLMRTMQVQDLLKMIPVRTRFDYLPDLPRLHERIYLGALYSFEARAPRLIQKILSFPTTTQICEERPCWNLEDAELDLEEFQSLNYTRIELHQLHHIELKPWQEHHSFHWYLKLRDASYITTAWLAQANHAFAASPFSSVSSADDFALTTDVRLTVEISDSKPENCLRGTFMAEPPTNDLFLFIANPKAVIHDGILSVTLLGVEDAFYWSFEPDGSIPLTPEELEDIIPPEVIFSTHVGTRTWPKEDYQLIRNFCIVKGIDSESTELAVQFGYPLAVIDDDHSVFQAGHWYGRYVGKLGQLSKGLVDTLLQLE
ncbi:hypothetical protein K438DRAFT_583068 [Mycena galopus ATCC 62051]|nr:hypothetical protein K438DRAFT_583068 [Mycena galopus ATCC 62051]